MSHLRNFLLPENGQWSLDILSGLTVALALIPEAIAFALVAHVNPLVGLYAAFFMCLTSAVLGGRPGMISGATGSMAVVIVSLVSKYGLHYLFATIVLTGLLQILVGVFRLGKLIRIMPKPVMVGFVNGLAIVIFLAQLQQFKLHTASGASTWLPTHALLLMIGLVLIAMAVTHYLPKITKKIPSALAAIILVTVITHVFHLHTRIVDDMMVGHHIQSAGLPTPAWLDVTFNLTTIKIILPYAIILCIIGLSESLMTLSLIDEVTQTKGNANRECIAQGIGNIISGIFKSMGGCVMIGQSMININAGGRGRLSGIIAACGLLSFIVIFWPFIKLIPLAALVGVMFMVVIETFEWATFKFIQKIPKHDAIVIATVMVVTVFTDLAVAVLVGIIISSLVFAWESAKHIYADQLIDDDSTKRYLLHGPLFFGSASTFKTLFDVANDPSIVIIDFANTRVVDHSAIDAIESVAQRYHQVNKRIHLRHLSPECRLLLNKVSDLIEVNEAEDPDYRLAV